MALATSLPNFRKRYGPWVDPLPSEDMIASAMEFVPSEMRQGGQFAFPVLVSQEQGITLNQDGSTFPTNGAIDARIEEAQIDGSEIAVVVEMSANELSRSSNGASLRGNDSPAFWRIPDLKMKQAITLGERVREMNLLWGPGSDTTIASDIGVVSASISGANLAAPQVVSLTRPSWIPGLWPLMQNALVDIYHSDGTTLRESGVTVQTVTNELANEIQLHKSSSTAVVAANDRIVLVGALGKSCYGIQAIGENAGELFNISATDNIVWRVGQKTSFGAPGVTKILQLAARLQPRGVTKGGTLYCGSPFLLDLIAEVEGTHRFINDEGPKVKRQGSSALVFTTPAGDIKVASHKYFKQGYAFFLANHPDEAGSVGKRVGSTDLTSDPQRGGMLFHTLEGATGARIRYYSHQAPILTIPWHCMWISGITSNADTLPGS